MLLCNLKLNLKHMMCHWSLPYLKPLSRSLFGAPLARIAEVLDPQGLREGINRKDTY
jgi:hypothetical protein